MRRALLLALLAAGLTTGFATAAPGHADFQAQPASRPAREIADWVVASGDNHGMAFVVIDKKQARLFVCSPEGRLRGASAALLGLARGDESAPGVGDRKLADIRPQERTTPAGRFVASLGSDLGAKDVV
jgi:hypothetical protein